MPGIVASLRVAVAVLAAFAAFLLALRVRTCPHRSEALQFALVLVLTPARVLMARSSAAAGLLSLALLWAAGQHAWSISGRRRVPGSRLWHLALGAAALGAGSVILIGYWQTVPARLLYGCGYAPLAIYTLVRYFLQVRRCLRGEAGEGRVGAGSLAVYGVALGALLVAAPLEVLLRESRGLDLAVAGAGLAVLAAAGCLLAHGGYLQGCRCRGAERGAGAPAPELRAARARAEKSESSLLLMDRLIATSLLSAGTVHEFRGVLAGIRACSEHALRRADGRPVREALERILEYARQGERTAVRHLDELVRHGREEPAAVDLASDLEDIFRLLRGTCRRQGVDLELSFQDGLVVRARPGEIIQVLLSLARNSLAALERRAMGSAGSRLSIRARRCDGEALLEILDNGPGPGPGEVERLFEPGASSRGSTGLGLYLSRQLAERNGGTLEYVPVELGSCFRISLPLAEDP